MAAKKNVVWLDGKIIDAEKAKVPILTHSLQYGSGIFEGIRSYHTDSGAAVFRLGDHVKRFFATAKIYGMDLGLTQEQMASAILKTVKASGFKECYIRPFAFYNDSRIGMSTEGKRISVFVGTQEMGSYLQKKGAGVRCKISSWRRINSEILPVEAKASGNYLNSIIANGEAKRLGFDEAILLSSNGYVAEGPGENIFIVKDGNLVTPGKGSDILLGITRDSLIKVAESIGIKTDERMVHKEEIYTADELFFAGTAAEMTPISEVDGIRIGDGSGRITKLLWNKFSDIIHGRDKQFEDWLTPV
ncbi:MAG: branched-chain amino acid transaminase [Candidatus Marsarchaeota archaeon]|jgi:branched-chain amino acid aminotransferase|nr:branched-chain amino acid transaminase [Candidatus Marsarchaeota archaeon]MCL5430873.1 branched-chain amino acid transaminase [Candidatus Marsarchaeota archaeon]